MSATAVYTVTETWTAVASNTASAFVQRQGGDEVYLLVTSGTAPTAGIQAGIIMARGELEEANFTSLDDGDVIYARCKAGEQARLVVIKQDPVV